MLSSTLALLQQNRPAVVERLVARVLSAIPRYSALDTAELRKNVEVFFGEIAALLEEGENSSLRSRFGDVAQRRHDQGFAAGDFLQAVLLAAPVVREVLIEAGGPNEALAHDLAAIELTLHEIAAVAANVFAEAVAKRLRAKNDELNRLNVRLAAHEKLASIEAMGASRALDAANEFNRRVIESLSSGLMVIDAQSMRVTLFTGRAEEILDVPAERALGQPLGTALGGLQGFDLEHLVDTVRSLGRLPLTKLELTLSGGRRRAVYVRAHRMFDVGGVPRGTVVVIDDITERELLFDSFARYVSRDLLRRLLVRAEPLGREGEKKSSTVLFVNLVGFAALGEGHTPEALHATLDAYFRAVVDGITLHGGFIDKFVGDKVMALFGGGDPLATTSAAARSALAVLSRVAMLGAERKIMGEPPLEVRIGINTGEVVLGNLGNEDRMEFTAIGDTVNLADGLSSAAGPGEVLLAEEAAKLVEARFRVESLGRRRMIGRAAEVPAYRLLAGERTL